MYIAIDGIPPGETVTYILPFWHKAEGFTLEEMESPAFREQCVRPAHRRVQDMNMVARGAGSQQISNGFMLGLTAFAGPLILCPTVLFPTFSSSGRTGFEPDAVHRVPSASAEMYSGVRERDLPALLAKAGLPAEQAAALARYNTEHFAVMRLTGRKVSRAEGDAAMGVHYRFSHATEGASYTYTYPLGTGAAWPTPILLTEVYAYGPDGLVLQGEAPTVGERTPSHALHWRNFARKASELRGAKKDDPTPGLFDPRTGSMMVGKQARSSAFHVGYLMANPAEDIRIRVSPRGNLAQLRLAYALGHPAAAWLICTLVFLLAWLPSLAVARFYWVREGRPDTLRRFWLARMGAIWARTVLAAGVVLPLLLPVPASGIWVAIPLTLSGACLVAILVLLIRRTYWNARFSGVWPMWLSAVGTYIALACIAVSIVRGIEAAV